MELGGVIVSDSGLRAMKKGASSLNYGNEQNSEDAIGVLSHQKS